LQKLARAALAGRKGDGRPRGLGFDEEVPILKSKALQVHELCQSQSPHGLLCRLTCHKNADGSINPNGDVCCIAGNGDGFGERVAVANVEHELAVPPSRL
jgi:hypothetical protein